jgi:hypothetical protein
MPGRVPAPVLVGAGHAARPARADAGPDGRMLRFDPGGPRWPVEPAEPARRPASPAALFWSRAALALLIAALLLPFSLTALVDLVRWLAR